MHTIWIIIGYLWISMQFLSYKVEIFFKKKKIIIIIMLTIFLYTYIFFSKMMAKWNFFFWLI